MRYTAWYEGTSDPLDSPRRDPRVERLGMQFDPRSLEQGLQQGVASPDAELPDNDPLSILLAREDADETTE